MAPKPNRASLAVLVLLATVFALPGLGPGAADAGMDRKSTAEVKKATQLYRQGNYEQAATIFLQLSIDNPGMPVFVRNLGACYYYLRRPEPALSNLREYLHRATDITPDDRAEVEGWIAEMDHLRQRGSAPAPALPAPVAPLAPVAPSAGPAVTPPMPMAQPIAPPQTPSALAPYAAPAPATGPGLSQAGPIIQLSQPAEAHPGHAQKVAAWVLGGVGLAGFAMGGVFSYLASSNFSDVEKKYDPGKHSQGKTYASAQWVGYGLGGAAIATAAILFLTAKDGSKSVVLAPTIGPGMAGAALTGGF